MINDEPLPFIINKGIGRLEAEPAPAHGVDEGDGLGVEHQSWRYGVFTCGNGGAAILVVAHDRSMEEGGGVNADLVFASCFEAELYE